MPTPLPWSRHVSDRVLYHPSVTAPVRHLPDVPFPAYAYVPGAAPHPTRDPKGHSYQTEPEDAVEVCPPDKWGSCAPYLFGVDLYNAGYLWEAHEAWESLWHVSKHDLPQAQFIQGLIQCTAATLKVRMEQPVGVEKLGTQGTERMETTALAVAPHYMGLNIPSFIGDFRKFVAGSPTSAETRPMIILED